MMTWTALVRRLRLGAACAAFALIGAPDDRLRVGHLTISATRDGDTTIVEVTGPRTLLDRAAAFSAGKATQGKACDDLAPFETPGFFVGWGDEKHSQTYVSPLPSLSEGCPNRLKHVYAVPGEYRITAALYHMGSTEFISDTIIGEWKDERSIAIEGKSPPLALSVTAPLVDKRLFFREPVTVRWRLSTSTPVDLLVEVFDQDGVKLAEHRFEGLKYVGEGEVKVRYDDNAYSRHLRHQATPVIARVHVQDRGRDLLVSDSKPFHVTAQWNDAVPRFAGAVVELAADPARTVRVRHYAGTKDCHSYGIDWGDGSPVELHLAAGRGSDGRCGENEGLIDTLHTYRQGGNYTIVLRTDEYGEADRSLINAPYQILSVTVR